MLSRFGLRLRFALFFAALAIFGSVAFGGGLYFGYARSGGAAEGYLIGWLIGTFGLVGLAAWVGLLFDENVAQPIRGLAAELRTRASADVSVAINETPARYLGSIAPAAQELFGALEQARARQAELLEQRTATMARDKALLETLIRDLAEGVVVLAPDGAILLYNRTATSILGPLGIDRPLGRFMNLEPVTEAMAHLDQARRAGSETFLTSTRDGSAMLAGAAARVAHEDALIGHVLIFHDATEVLRAQGQLDTVLRDLIDTARRPAMAISAILDVLRPAASDADVDATTTAMTQALDEEVARLGTALNDAEHAQADLTVGNWPIRPVAADELLASVQALNDVHVACSGSAATLQCDGFAVTKIWEKVLRALQGDPERRDFALSVEAGDTGSSLVLTWQGSSLAQATLDAVLRDPLAPAYEPYCGADVLKAHRTDLRIERGPRLVMPLARVVTSMSEPRKELYDFYDFSQRTGVRSTDRLSDLAFVVFDTETTGLDTARDDVVQLAGVRILRDRFVRGETFDSLVAPERDIPASASRIHGVTNDMVRSAPGFADACADFASFAEGAVLVAHNAEFDMAFLKRLETRGGPRFDNPVLCTARLSAKLNAHSADHTLDALADRYGVSLADDVRHTALGDATATAEVFLKMLPVLAHQNVSDLEDALRFQAS